MSRDDDDEEEEVVELKKNKNKGDPLFSSVN